MSLRLYAHPFSSYSQKVLIALYENSTAFEFKLLEPGSGALEDWSQRWPIRRFPMLVDGERQIVEASSIIEYLHLRQPGPVQLIPDDPDQAVQVRMLDRIFDNYISNTQQALVNDALRTQDTRDPLTVTQARQQLDTAYAWLDQYLHRREWAVADSFSLADCAAAPALFYADWSHRIAPGLRNLLGYRQRLLQRPSFARAVDEARPYRPLFPLGAPDRD